MDGKILGNDKFLCSYSKILIALYVGVGFLEKIHSIVNVVLALDGALTALALAYVILWFYVKRRFPTNPGVISLLIMTIFILFSSLVGLSDLDRFSVAGFAIVETWALILAVVEVRKDIHDVFFYFSIFAIVFTFVYSLIGLVQGIESEELRFSGLSDQSNSLGVMASISIILCMANIRKFNRIDATIVWNVITMALIPFFLYVLLKSDSRTSFFGLAFSTIVIIVVSFLFLKGRSSAFWAVIPALVVVVAALVFILTGERSLNSFSMDKLTSGRTTIWKETLGVMETKEYIFGFSGNTDMMINKLKRAGASNVTVVNQGERHLAHNMFLGMLFEYGGVVALSFTFGWFWIMMKGIMYMGGKKKWALREVFASFVILSFFIVHSFAESSIYFIGGAEQLVFILSIAAIYATAVARKRGTNE